MLKRKINRSEKDKDIGMNKKLSLYKVVGEVLSDKLSIEQRPKKSKRTSHMGEKHSRPRKQYKGLKQESTWVT